MDKIKKIVNDNELLYLIQEGSEEALEEMFRKYEPLIRSKISKFKIEEPQIEDYVQEGRLRLLRAIKLYDTSSQKTFNKYFDLILTNHFITLLRKNRNYNNVSLVLEDEIVDEYKRSNEYLEDIDFSKLQLSNLEKEIYKMRFLRNQKVSDICQVLSVSEKTVYNSIQRIKVKLEKLK